MNHDITSNMGTGFTYIEKAYIPDISETLSIVDEICHLVEQYFAAKVPCFTLINDITSDGPYTSSDYTEIHLRCVTKFWSQIAYQFSHEICHLMIGAPVVPNLCWFEESIAELSSWFFMQRLISVWLEKSLLGKPDYAALLYKYIDDRIQAITYTFALPDLFDETSEISEYLRANCYDRNANAQVAKALLPVFNEKPFLWQAVPLLKNIPPNLSFRDSLNAWHSLSEEHFNKSFPNIAAALQSSCSD